MKIAAFYIPQDHLPFIFGDNHEPLIINFGGKNIYHLDGEYVTASENRYFIDDLLSDSIDLFSCIVGNNGGGKTTLLHQISNGYGYKYIMEKDNGDWELSDGIESVHRVYFTPYLNHSTFDEVTNNSKDLSKLALLKLDNHGDQGLFEEFLDAHNSETVKRWVEFNDFYSTLGLKEIPLPIFEKVEIELNHFENNIHKPRNYHDTSSQLTSALTQLFEKISEEGDAREIEAGRGKKITNREAEKISVLVRFEYALYETALGKFVLSLERAGNKYLEEGYISEDYHEKISSLEVRYAMQWFFENAGVFKGEEKHSFANYLSLFDLIDYIISIHDDDSITDNWRKINVYNDQALMIMRLYNVFNNSFIGNWFNYVEKPMFRFRPDMVISSGEQSFLNLFSTLYYHAENIKNGVDIDLHSSASLEYINDKVLLLIDEGDNAFHPQWKKEYVKYLRQILPLIFSGYKLQVIITSHDPLTLSDLPKNNVIFLEKMSSFTVLGQPNYRRTFGANISDLFKDTFFMKDGQIGSFVAGVIGDVISDIKTRSLDPGRVQEIRRLINCIDEPIIKFKLGEMLSEATDDKSLEKQLIDEEIIRLQERRNRIQ
ncbi:MAG: hypothetical protein EOO20_04795 [Chryseobacterium sp.]|uniref:hypothetical protein n=1 Tax=Pedobacter agri TaxID=454586 RepID=UPI0012094422|nr:hypothetical protein [Pedobacter agri]RZJ91506.1 MAG: hypothetical protein EOO20_04795 [Chryseobacterium sp.]